MSQHPRSVEHEEGLEEVDGTSVAAGSAGEKRKSSSASGVVPSFFLGMRPKAKKLILVRHAKTIGYHVQDTILSAGGQEMASSLAKSATFAGHLAKVTCVVVSPLRRAMETSLLALSQHITLIGEGDGSCWPSDTADSSSSASVATAVSGPPPPAAEASASAVSASALGTGRPLPLFLTSLAREKLSTVGDRGSPPGSVDKSRFGPFLAAHSHLSHEWWLKEHGCDCRHKRTATKKPRLDDAAAAGAGGAEEAAVARAEDGAAFKRRMDSFRSYLRALPHDCILIISHAFVIKELAGISRFPNFCEVIPTPLVM